MPLLEDLEQDGIHIKELENEEMVCRGHVPKEEGKPEETAAGDRKRQWDEDGSGEAQVRRGREIYPWKKIQGPAGI